MHSIAAALFLQKDRIHFFNDMGYEHNPYTHCPTDPDIWKKRKCSCDPKESFGKCDDFAEADTDPSRRSQWVFLPMALDQYPLIWVTFRSQK